ncbi:hypothetical protein DID74_00805 [Candidatus Marinamargulisbacteria bacterium SCGC AG-333-B06]|nr:hypothetical protein DID74_00805 [Candidatus Marinamargulisbacteria bacterium SCGC AG-333-B06]
MVTLLLIACNQEYLLKKHLSSYQRLLKSVNGNIILVDDGSVDRTKEYIHTHFNSIKYMRNPKEIGYCQSFNTVLPYINTPYFLCVDLHIDIHYLPLQETLSYVQHNHLFMAGFSCSSQQKISYGYGLCYQGLNLHLRSLQKKTACFFSEVMLLDTKRVLLFNGLSDHYHTLSFSWYDLIFRSVQQGQIIKSFDTCLCQKKTSQQSVFSYLCDQYSMLKDSFLFQWRFCHSFNFIFKRILSIIFIVLSFNAFKILHIFQAYFQWLFFTKRYRLNWYSLSENDIIFQKNSKRS